MDSAVAFNPAGEWDRPALSVYLGTAPPYVKGMNPGREQLFPPGSWPSGHIPARIRRHSYVVKGVVAIQGEYGCNDPPTGDASRSIKLPSHLQDYGRPWLGELTGSQGKTPLVFSLASPQGHSRVGIVRPRELTSRA